MGKITRLRLKSPQQKTTIPVTEGVKDEELNVLLGGKENKCAKENDRDTAER